MLKKLLDNKKCFKLICGAGNENLAEVEKLVALYAKAGCHFFDFAANEDVLKAAKRGLDFTIPREEQKDYHFCVSIGTKNDQHMLKAKIDYKTCKNCGKCVEVCPQDAINWDCTVDLSIVPKIEEKNCIGCAKCKSVCENNAIGLTTNKQKNKLFNPVSLPFAIYSPLPISCIEFHASDIDENEVDKIWAELNENFDGFLSICIGREKLSNEQIVNRIRRLTSERPPSTTIIQVDGSPMSGGKDDFKTTLQAVAIAEMVQNANIEAHLILSGGTNSKTAELAKLCGVNFAGIAVGSYARKIVKEYIERKDFFSNEAIFDKALKIAINLIEACC